MRNSMRPLTAEMHFIKFAGTVVLRRSNLH